MARITSDCVAMCLHEHQMALITSDCVQVAGRLERLLAASLERLISCDCAARRLIQLHLHAGLRGLQRGPREAGRAVHPLQELLAGAAFRFPQMLI